MNLHLSKKSGLRKRVALVALAGTTASLSFVISATAGAGAASNPGFALYAAEGYDTAAAKAFNATHPGFTVTVNDNSTGPLLEQIQAEGNNPKWGVLWADGSAAFAQLDNEGYLVKHSVPNVKFNALGKENVPADDSFTPTGLTVTGALCYDSSQVSASQLPSTWAQLTDSKYKGMIGMNDPSQSGPTYPMIAGVMDEVGHYKKGSTASAVAAGETFYKNLYSNGIVVNSTNGPTITAMESDSIQMATIQSSACYGAELTSYPTMRVKYLNYSIALPSVIGIDAKASPVVRADAQKFVNWVMSPAGQHVMQTGDPTGDSLFWPVINGEKPANSIIPSLASTHAISLDPYVWGPPEAKINAWFDANIANDGL
ncbi:MAG TPA: extracellular solute-binding protein [Acidimicrobiales bacterium]|jgi:iron(III) transport system substrate-binding protein|nr:extracellular solute-binding protein [Acidimicrobiales bacterium]